MEFLKDSHSTSVVLSESVRNVVRCFVSVVSSGSRKRYRRQSVAVAILLRSDIGYFTDM